MSNLTTRTCSVCKKFDKPMADCPHPGRTVTDKTELTDRGIAYTVGMLKTADRGYVALDDCAIGFNAEGQQVLLEPLRATKPMPDGQIGWLKGQMFFCNGCSSGGAAVFPINVLPYKASCCVCGKVVIDGGSHVELFGRE